MDSHELGHYHEKGLLHKREEINKQIADLDQKAAQIERGIRLIQAGTGREVERNIEELRKEYAALEKQKDSLTKELEELRN